MILKKISILSPFFSLIQKLSKRGFLKKDSYTKDSYKKVSDRTKLPNLLPCPWTPISR